MKNVGELLTNKPGTVFSVSPDASILDALKLLAEHDVGALPVVENDRLCGIFSERDYARGVILRGRSSRDTAVRELMTTNVVTIATDDSIVHCMETMTTKRIRHLPVVEGDRMTGIVTIGDIVKQIISDQTHTIEQLESYIQGH